MRTASRAIRAGGRCQLLHYTCRAVKDQRLLTVPLRQGILVRHPGPVYVSRSRARCRADAASAKWKRVDPCPTTRRARFPTGGPSMAALKVALVTGSGKRRIGWHVADAL